MSRVSLKGGKAEMMLAKALWHSGYRYRKNFKKLPGSPDIAILKYNIAVFIDGEFWHGKDWESGSHYYQCLGIIFMTTIIQIRVVMVLVVLPTHKVSTVLT